MKLSRELLKQVDPYGGFLLLISIWRPNPDDPDPEMPGLKQQTLIFVSVKPEDACLCGSGQPYQDCCRPKPLWQPICHNPGAQDYSLVVPQEALFKQVDGATLRERFRDDPRLVCVEDTPDSGFWILWGDPAVETEYGMICFGDLELKPDNSLLVTAMSDTRMHILLDLLQEIAADCLGPSPKITKDPPPVLQKPAQKSQRPRTGRFWRKRRH